MKKLILTLMVVLIGFSGCTSPDADSYTLLLNKNLAALATASISLQEGSVGPVNPNPSPSPNPGPAPPAPTPVDLQKAYLEGYRDAEKKLALASIKKESDKLEVKNVQFDLSPAALEKLEGVMQKFEMGQPLSASTAILKTKVKAAIGEVTKTAPDPPPVRTSSGINWSADLYAAQKEGKEKNKPIYVHWTQPGCGPCVRMENNVLSNPGIIDLVNSNFINCKVNTQEMPESVMDDYKISGTPTDMVFTSNWQLSKKLQSSANASSFKQELENGLNWAKNLNKPNPAPIPVKPVVNPKPVVIYEPAYYHMPQTYYYNGGCSSGSCGFSGSCSGGNCGW